MVVWRPILVLLLSALMNGCGTVSFYWQAMNGQWELSRKSRPIGDVISDQATPESLRQRLRQVEHMRAFAVSELGLPDNASYRKYADLKRPFVVWNVFATGEFSVIPKEWCFPIAGCVGYRGYFKESAAQAFAADLRKRGHDVFVAGIPAYSTLGYLDDPVLNTFIGYSESEVARLIFHELSHQVAYVKDDTTFNESFATAVELEGVRRWLKAAGSPEMQIAFDAAQGRKRNFLQLIDKHKQALATLYGKGLPAAQTRAAKATVFREMLTEYETLKQQWGGFAGCDFWFKQPLNNAQLASLGLYSALVPHFQNLLTQVNGDLPRFYAEVRKLTEMKAAQRQALLDQTGPQRIAP
ncbi:MAG: aminopeptidase [Betaproteobacteria bacterium]|nr:aminopeptidase [Betaproteobacteria bacterium]